MTVNMGGPPWALVRKLKVLMGWKEVERVGFTQTVEFSVKPGLHEFQVKIENQRSEPPGVVCKPGEVIDLSAGTNKE